MSDEDEVAYEGAVQLYMFKLFTNIASYKLFTRLWCNTRLPDSVKVVRPWKTFGCQKHQLNANKYFPKFFLVNQGAKLYVIMLFIL